MGNSNNEANQQINRMQAATNNADRNRWRKIGGKHHNFAALIALIIICGIWTVAAHVVAKTLSFLILKMLSKKLSILYQICMYFAILELRCTVY